jgi:hypothetical protein
MELDADKQKLIKSNKRWWSALMADHGYTCRSLGSMVGLSGADISNIMNSHRNIKASEAVAFARIFNLDMGEFVYRAQALAPKQRAPREGEKKSPYTPVVGWVDGKGAIIKLGKDAIMEKPVVRPARGDADTKAVRIMNGGDMHGWIAYYQSLDYVHDKAKGALSVVETTTRRKMLCYLQPGGKGPSYRIISLDKQREENVNLKTAAPVVWLKPEIV